MVQVEYTCIWGTFDLVVFNVIFGHLVTLRFFQKYNFQNSASSTHMIIFQKNVLHVFPLRPSQKSLLGILKFQI